MRIEELLSRKLLIISGKGGVGKTTVALSLAFWAIKSGKNVCIVEMNSTERVAPFFGLSSIGYQEVALATKITGINLNPRDCFEEYVVRQIKFKALFDTFINNKFVTHFLNAVPGFNELLMIGKIYDLVYKTKGFSKKNNVYDLIIVDGPATGHGVSAFEVPQIVSNAVKVGPMKNQSEAILGLLKDPAKTIFCPVTLGEEMPVQECLEMMATVKNKLGIAMGPIFLNQYHETPFSKNEEALILKKNSEPLLAPYLKYAALKLNRAEQNSYYYKTLSETKAGVQTIPFLADFKIDEASIKRIAEVFGG